MHCGELFGTHWSVIGSQTSPGAQSAFDWQPFGFEGPHVSVFGSQL